MWLCGWMCYRLGGFHCFGKELLLPPDVFGNAVAPGESLLGGLSVFSLAVSDS